MHFFSFASGGEFKKRDVKMLAISCDPLESHQGWLADIKAHTGNEVNFPLIADPDRRQACFARLYDVVYAFKRTLFRCICIRFVCLEML